MVRSTCIKDAAIAAFGKRLESARRIGIITHTRPDGDAIGSSLAMLRFIRSRYPRVEECRILLDTPLPSSIEFILHEEDCTSIMVAAVLGAEPIGEYIAGCDLLVVLDMNTPSRCGEIESSLRNSKAPKVLIDHHMNPEAELFDPMFSTNEVSSTCELLAGVLCALQGSDDIPFECCDPLLTGITTDTNNFANSIFPATLETVSLLLKRGARRDEILYSLYNSYPERRFRLMGRLLDSGLTITENGAAIMVLDSETSEAFGIEEGDTEGFVNIPLGIGRVRLSVFAKQDAGEYRISLRSKPGCSANALAVKYFQGGGHELASGGKIPFGPSVPTKDEILSLIIRYTDEFFQAQS